MSNGKNIKSVLAKCGGARLAHAGVLLLALGLEITMVQKSGYGNSYYAAAVKSMLSSWHNFFFAAYDPGGFISVDKPPLALWLQTLSAKIFGFQGWALLLPALLAQVFSVEILYRLVRRVAGERGGILAALFLALTPISVVLGGTNETDPILILFLLLSGWFLLKSIESEKTKHLLLSGAFIGLAFNVKMLQAYILLPAFFLTYLLAGRVRLRRKSGQLLAAAALILVVSFSWVLAVDMVPASARPYVGSTEDNSELSLATGYNGMQRILGQESGFMLATGGQDGKANATGVQNRPNASGSVDGAAPMPIAGADAGGGFPGGRGNGPGGNSFGGETGVFRLWGSALGGQIGWYLAFALAGLLAFVSRKRLRLPLSEKGGQIVFWLMWLLAGGAVFSAANFMHPYYTATIAPPIAALAGIGIVQMGKAYGQNGWKRFLLPLALLLSAWGQWTILSPYAGYGWLKLAAAGTMIAATLILLAGILGKKHKDRRIFRGAAALGLAGMMLAPVAWVQYSLAHTVNATIPAAGPESEWGGMGGFPGMPGEDGSWRSGPGGGPQRDGRTLPPDGGNAAGAANARGMAPNGPGFEGGAGLGGSMFGSTQADEKLVDYLLAHRGSAKYIVATESSHSADALIILTGLPVMAWGGFSGTDPALDVVALERYTQEGQVKYFLMSYGGREGGNNSEISSWISAHCRKVTDLSLSGNQTLYEFMGRAD
jgi:4-amino-4-deoxy-L-arabinose transferase-like glycosyltransferase